MARYLLWTNGSLLPEDLEPFRRFANIVITDYSRDCADLYLVGRSRMLRLSEQQSGVRLCQWPLDGRLNTSGPRNRQPCARMFVEMIIDYYGNVHLCCFDWRGIVSPGNVQTTGFTEIVAKWRGIREAIAGRLMTGDAPSVCRFCTARGGQVPVILPPRAFVPEAVEAARQYVKELRAKPEEKIKPHTAVVFVAYKHVPESRIQEHFAWNDKLYQANEATVYMVSDEVHEVPEYTRSVVFHEEGLPHNLEGKPVFSLCKTKNVGIQCALNDGAEVVIVTDVDMAFPNQETWDHLVDVRIHEARMPMCRMVAAPDRRDSSWVDAGMANTIAMRAVNWRRIQYDEACVGYGADDGIMLDDIKRAGFGVNRSCEMYHVHHPGTEAGVKNWPGRGRAGCYGRTEGFNPENFVANAAVQKEKRKRRRR